HRHLSSFCTYVQHCCAGVLDSAIVDLCVKERFGSEGAQPGAGVGRVFWCHCSGAKMRQSFYTSTHTNDSTIGHSTMLNVRWRIRGIMKQTQSDPRGRRLIELQEAS